MKIKALVTSTLFALIAAQTSYASNKLFPTDILDKNDFDAQINVGYQSQSLDVTSRGNAGTQRIEIADEKLILRYGLGEHWQLVGELPYRSHDSVKTDFSNPVAHFTNTSNQGSQNPLLALKYGIVDDPDSKLSLSLRLSVSPDITNKNATIYGSIISAGWKASDTLKYYSEVEGNLNDNSNGPDTLGIAFGAYKQVCESATLIPHVGFTQFYSTSTSSSFSQVDIGLASDIQISENTYLIPNAVYFTNSSKDSTNTFHASASNGRAFSIGLYHLF